MGDRIRVDGLEGVVEEIGTVKTQVLDDEGQLVSISNRSLIEQRVSR